jgi:hypothetical protein
MGSAEWLNGAAMNRVLSESSVLTVQDVAETNLKTMDTLAAFPNCPVRVDGTLRKIDDVMFPILSREHHRPVADSPPRESRNYLRAMDVSICGAIPAHLPD